MLMPFSKRAIGESHIVGDHIELKGYKHMKFEIMGIQQLEGETYYKVRPILDVYAVPSTSVIEPHHSEKVRIGTVRL